MLTDLIVENISQYIPVPSHLCAPYTYLVFYVNYFSIKLKRIISVKEKSHEACTIFITLNI